MTSRVDRHGSDHDVIDLDATIDRDEVIDLDDEIGPDDDHDGIVILDDPDPDPDLRTLGLRRPVGLGILAGYLVLVSGLQLAGVVLPVPGLSALLGLGAVLGVPFFLIYQADPGRCETATERTVWTLALTLLVLIATGLGANTVLPLVGVTDPLGLVWTIVTVDLACLALAATLRHRHPATYRFVRPSFTGADRVVIRLAGACVALSIMGAIRLNNGRGGGLTLLMLVMAAIALVALVGWAERLSEAGAAASMYLLSAALLFMTSVRGWYTTGHDVQREFVVFQLTQSLGRWDMSAYRDAYNACLSITILPTVLSRWVPVDSPTIYKIVFQVLFAASTVGVYVLARRWATRTVALIGTVFFISFVTFFQDMPMLDRQEIGFLFLIPALLAAFRTDVAVRRRQLWFVAFGCGLVLAHYSTTYMLIGVLLVAIVLRAVGRPLSGRVVPARWIRDGSPIGAPAWRDRPGLTILPVGVLCVAAFVWAGPVTHTGSGLVSTVSSAVASVRGASDGTESSSDTAYGLLSNGKASPQERLDALRQRNLQLTEAARSRGEFYDAATISPLATPVVAPAQLRITAAGEVLGDLGVDVPSLQSTVRQASAWLLQILMLVGLVAVAFGRRRLLTVTTEYFTLAAASVVVIAIQLAAPVLTVEYGLLRSFQQALVILDVFLVVGVASLIPKLGERRRLHLAGAAAIALFVSSTGVITQSLGGYPPQLHLNNAGTYYDIYYLHPEELAATAWLRTNTEAGLHGEVQSEVQTDRYTFTRLQAPRLLNPLDDIAPEFLRPSAYVFLGYSNVTKDQSTTIVASDLITYRYPVAFLEQNKDLIYSSGGARVYR